MVRELPAVNCRPDSVLRGFFKKIQEAEWGWFCDFLGLFKKATYFQSVGGQCRKGDVGSKMHFLIL